VVPVGTVSKETTRKRRKRRTRFVDLDARNEASANIVRGAMVLGIGLAVTLGTRLLAQGSGGGYYVVAWGAVVFGAMRLIYGIFQFFV
jgi:hypothetical protein